METKRWREKSHGVYRVCQPASEKAMSSDGSALEVMKVIKMKLKEPRKTKKEKKKEKKQ